VMRHSNQVPGCSLMIEEIFQDADFPEGVFNSVITGHDVVMNLIESPLVRGVSFTGGVNSGRKVGEAAGRNLKKIVLELGGSDPFIVLDDADIQEAARIGANARLVCCGQSAIGAKRFIVVSSVAADFLEAFIEELSRRTVGDPLDAGTDVGPLANSYQVSLLDAQVKDAVSRGAEPKVGGKPRAGIGSFYELTVLENVTPEMRVLNEEVFGPVAPVSVVRDEEAAIGAANNSRFGLGASIWTADMTKAKELVNRIESGLVFVNEITKSDPRMPFGGIKQSGFGRELSRFGLEEFVNVKSVSLYDGESMTGPTEGVHRKPPGTD